MSRHDIFPAGALAVLGALEGKSVEEMAQSLLEQEEEIAKENTNSVKSRKRCDEYTVGEMSEEEKAAQLEKRYGITKEDKAAADKAAKLIARDYGKVIKKLEEE